MSDSTETLRHELEAAQRALAEAQARCARHDAEYQTAAKEVEDSRSAQRFMLEDLESARRKIEQAHHEWMAALDVVNDPIFLHDKQFRIMRCNKAYRQCAGLPFKQIIGQPYYEIFPKTGAPLAGCLRVMEYTEAAADVEEMVVGDVTYRSRTYSVYGEQGAYLHSVHILEDITERKRAEDALQEATRKLGTTIDNLSGFIYRCRNEPDWPTEYVSKGVFDLLGHPAEEFVSGKRAFGSFIVPADRDRVWLEVQNAVETRHPYILEYRVRNATGDERWVWEQGRGVFDEGAFVALEGFVTDITERKRAEAPCARPPSASTLL